MDDLLIELNIALIPDAALAGKLADASQAMATKYPAYIQLGHAHARLAMAPHLTLYQTPIRLKDMEQTDTALREITEATPAFTLASTSYLYNAGEASFEIGYETTDALMRLQTQAIDALNPLRSDLLLERDPGGNDPRQALDAPGALGENLRTTGYGEVGELFRPHATLNWFKIGTEIDLSDPALPAATSFSGTYEALGIFALGPHGTCPQLLRQYELA